MKRIDLIEVEHNRKIGSVCEYIEPNVTEDCIFYSDGEPIGFYLNKMPEKMCKLADLANAEFRSKNVPKSIMNRLTAVKGLLKTEWEGSGEVAEVSQMSVILGSIPPKPMVRRPYASRSSVHSVESAQIFIKAMLLLAKESESLIKEILPQQYEQQLELFSDVDKKWRFSNLFTGSISNYNISAPFHRDNGNIKGAVNVIICKKQNSKGGDLHIPDYDATIGQNDNSILVYPAWRNVHAVTPIIPSHEGGYRNSLIFYPLRAFKGL
tara:strand:+ start:1910 stop:2707 length:798 start_codon:yes stop_codon:yes gene_type:complete